MAVRSGFELRGYLIDFLARNFKCSYALELRLWQGREANVGDSPQARMPGDLTAEALKSDTVRAEKPLRWSAVRLAAPEARRGWHGSTGTSCSVPYFYYRL